ncbi:hypothetical protein O181_036571 [Austropuccinia psidii MF-1]|uniref:Integrase catalytic domain-containing protein n=1 Tax=Austropuccinia psidii MF-1 TaxID=1389203 RepID=A0A9Q3HA11_9BASI|nr:hypothetical protein [Austropuccinia psidii MF-1]
MFVYFKETRNIQVSTGDSSSSLWSNGIGTVNILCNGKCLSLKNCLYVPKLNHSLISLLKLCQENMFIKLSNNSFSLEKNGTTILKGTILNNLMQVDYTSPTTLSTFMGLPPLHSSCQVCELNKAILLRFNVEFEHYFLTIVDQFTSFKTIRILKSKSETFDQFIIVKNSMENLHDCKLKKLVSDLGGEFLNHCFSALANTKGLTHYFSPAETPQHNGFAERANQTILEKTQCMLNGSNLPTCYWAEAVLTATILCNLIPTPSRHNPSPYALWKGVPPRIKRLHIFSCRAIVSIPKSHCGWKLGPTGSEGILPAYENDNTGYQILCLSDKKIVISRHVTFDESSFPSPRDSPSKPLTINCEASRTDSELVDEAQPEEEAVVDEAHSEKTTAPCVNNSPASLAEQSPDLIPDQAPCCIKVIGPWNPTLINSKIDSNNILSFSRRPKTYLKTSKYSPPTFKSALNSSLKDEWSKAVNKEFDSMNRLQVWDVVELKSDYRLVGTTCVFKTKRNLGRGLTVCHNLSP